MFEAATGAALVVLLIAYVATSVAVGWLLTRDAPAWQRALLLAFPFVVAPFAAYFPAVLLLAWVGLNSVALFRGVARE